MNKEALEAITKFEEWSRDDIVLNHVRPEILMIKKELTPPTEKEVCEALSEHYGHEVIFRMNGFHVCMNGENFMVMIDKLKRKPHLLTLLGRFYEGLEDNETD